MPHQYNLINAVALHAIHGRVNIGEILLHIPYLKCLLSLHKRPAVFPQVHRIEIIARVNETVAHLLLEKIIVESVDIEYPAMTAALRKFADNGRAHLPAVIVRLIYITHLITVTKAVGHPLCCRRDDSHEQKIQQYGLFHITSNKIKQGTESPVPL